MNFKYSLRVLIAAFGLAGAGVASTMAQTEIFVISNPATQIAASDIKEVFTGGKQFSGSIKLIPVDNGPAQESFLSSVLGMNAPHYNTIWTKKSFREGLNPPSVKSSDREVLNFVRKTQGAVGYVRNEPSGVNIIGKY